MQRPLVLLVLAVSASPAAVATPAVLGSQEPGGAAAAGPDGAETGAYDLVAAEARGVEILLRLQEDYAQSEPQGRRRGANFAADRVSGAEWPYEGVYREGGFIPSGYRVGGTAICALALLESRAFADDPKVIAAVRSATGFILEHLEQPAMDSGFSGTYDVRGWGHAYALDFLLRLRAHKAVPADLAEAVPAKISWLVQVLEDTVLEGRTGGWNYSRRSPKGDSSPFMTGPTLLALWEAQKQGEDVDQAILTGALAGLESSRFEDGSIPYSSGGRPGSFMNEKPGAMGRMAVTEVVLLHAGRSRPQRLEDAVQTFFQHWDQLEVRRRKQGTHIEPYGVAPYYVFFAYRYVAMAIEHLPRAKREKYRTLFLEHLFRIQEASGGWNDRVFERSENYGTAMSLLAMRQPELPLPSLPEPSPGPATKKK